MLAIGSNSAIFYNIYLFSILIISYFIFTFFCHSAGVLRSRLRFEHRSIDAGNDDYGSGPPSSIAATRRAAAESQTRALAQQAVEVLVARENSVPVIVVGQTAFELVKPPALHQPVSGNNESQCVRRGKQQQQQQQPIQQPSPSLQSTNNRRTGTLWPISERCWPSI